MNLNEMLNTCRTYFGENISHTSIYRYGKQVGFLKKDPNKQRYIVDEILFNDWISKSKINSSYISLKDARREYETSYSELKYLLKKNNCEIVKCGIKRKGLMYAKRKDIERVIKQYHKRIKDQEK